ncbi:MAG: carboxypeptidase regulatory-like domain-containing protein, partial [Flavobacterium sp.]
MHYYYHILQIAVKKVTLLTQNRLLYTFILFTLIGSNAFGQSTDASVNGKITDEKGSGIPGASIVLRNESTGFRTVTSTGKDGSYSLIQLPLGKPYTLTVTYIGYPKQVKTDFALNQGDHIMADFKLTESANQLSEV